LDKLKSLSLLLSLTGLFLFIFSSCNNSESNIADDISEKIVYQIPFTNNQQHKYQIINSQEDVIGWGFLSSFREEGRLVLEQKYFSSKNETATDEIILVVDSETLKPLAGLREISHINFEGKQINDVYEWLYDNNQDFPKLKSTITRHNEINDKSLDLFGNYFDNETSFWLWRTFNFSDGGEILYSASLVLDNDINNVSVSIFPQELIEVPGGTYNAWRLVIRNGRALASVWINTLSPYEMIRYDNGDIVLQLSN